MDGHARRPFGKNKALCIVSILCKGVLKKRGYYTMCQIGSYTYIRSMLGTSLFVSISVHTISRSTMDVGITFVSPGRQKMVNIHFTRMEEMLAAVQSQTVLANHLQLMEHGCLVKNRIRLEVVFRTTKRLMGNLLDSIFGIKFFFHWRL